MSVCHASEPGRMALRSEWTIKLLGWLRQGSKRAVMLSKYTSHPSPTTLIHPALKRRTMICQSAHQVDHDLNPSTLKVPTTIDASVTLYFWRALCPMVSFLFFVGSHREAVPFALVSARASSRAKCNARDHR
ncbi:BZ3500_MvSof-1268-A1-R1_Chr10-1g02749 [Microbotryum saponariae]|uniref:BZ3500_MvSof-1268-A1-R1_Chr10-1g02749 protein n=1 Tax=Microbotryum saponariae TaxID=289078 RepID=A0A2X0L4G2_9BASI|nr:BZ3500_MvSof-1268-A1-R1_Chr10-1g02749 [Microbotryum saponariae]SDA06238.1 BZ3501_MvSof-1269-A2-R1_Chr10-1g02350 [Microbotryum saponariae]